MAICLGRIPETEGANLIRLRPPPLHSSPPRAAARILSESSRVVKFRSLQANLLRMEVEATEGEGGGEGEESEKMAIQRGERGG